MPKPSNAPDQGQLFAQQCAKSGPDIAKYSTELVNTIKKDNSNTLQKRFLIRMAQNKHVKTEKAAPVQPQIEGEAFADGIATLFGLSSSSVYKTGDRPSLSARLRRQMVKDASIKADYLVQVNKASKRTQQ